MKNSHILWPKHGLSTYATVFVILLACSAFSVGQTKPATTPGVQFSNDLNKYPGLLPEFAHLLDKLQHDIQFPPPRAESRLLPLLPESTVFYAAFPNYGDASHQAVQIFHQELQESPVLRDWWKHVNSQGPSKAEDFLQKLYELSQYLGDEVVISGSPKNDSSKDKQPSVLFIAEVRKPGVKAFLEQMLAQLPPTPRPPLRILEPRDLAFAKDVPNEQPVVLVRPDFVIASSDVATLRSFNARLASASPSTLAATPFGHRVTQAYDGGVSIVGAADLQRILKLAPEQPKDKEMAFQSSGFADMKYLVWQHKTVAGRDLSQAELTFNGPRQGAAAWLAPPRHLGSLDFVSPKAMFAVSLGLASPARIFDDIEELASTSASPANPNPLAMAGGMAQAIGLNIKDDLLSLLTGELTVELVSVHPPNASWRMMLGVKNAAHFQRTLSTLFTASHAEPHRFEESGTTFYSVTVPSPAKPVEIEYAFVGGYLVIGSSHEALAEAIRLHQDGGSLGKSQTFLASLPPGHPTGISALLFEDPTAMMSLGLSRATPDVRDSLASMFQTKSPVIVCAYGDDDAIREATTSTAFDPTAILIGAAIAVPNFQHAKVAANESSAVGMLRTVVTAQTSYSTMYPRRGFAPDLANLGKDPAAPGTPTANHAGLVDAALGNPSCTASSWCEKNGFRFRVSGECRQNSRMCREFVAVATPVDSNTGTRNFCSTSEGIIRFQQGPPLSSPVTASECKSWQVLQ